MHATLVLLLRRCCDCGGLSARDIVAGNVTVAGVEYPLFTHVHHGYGLNDAFDRSVTLLTRHAAGRRGLLAEVTAIWRCGAMQMHRVAGSG